MAEIPVNGWNQENLMKTMPMHHGQSGQLRKVFDQALLVLASVMVLIAGLTALVSGAPTISTAFQTALINPKIAPALPEEDTRRSSV